MIQCVWHEQRLNPIHSKLGSTELLLTKSLFDRKRNVSSFADYRYCKSYKLNSEHSLIRLGSRWNAVKPHSKQGGVLPGVGLADFGRNDYLLWITSNSCTPIRTPRAVSLRVQSDHSFTSCPTAVAIYPRGEHQRLPVCSYSGGSSLTRVCVRVWSGRTEGGFI